MLGLAQLGTRLGVQLDAQLGIGWGISIRFGLAQGSAGPTCLGLVLGIGSELGSAVPLNCNRAWVSEWKIWTPKRR